MKSIQIIITRIILLLFLNQISQFNSSVRQKYSYESYTTYTSTTTDYHNIKIQWKDSASDFNVGGGTALYEICRNSEGTASSSDDTDTLYSQFVLSLSGIKSTKYYVAWDFNGLSCTAGVTTVTFKIKIFDCSSGANYFYSSLTATTGKIEVGSDGTIINTDSANAYTISGIDFNYSANMLLGLTDNSFLSNCSSS